MLPVEASTAFSTKSSVPSRSTPPSVRTQAGEAGPLPVRSTARWRSGTENSAYAGLRRSMVRRGSAADAETVLPACTRRRPVRPGAGARRVQYARSRAARSTDARSPATVASSAAASAWAAADCCSATKLFSSSFW